MTTTGMSEAPVSSAIKDSQAIKILIVGDQPENVRALESMLEELGQDIVVAGVGEEPLRRVLSGDFAVILVDIKMPAKAGFSIAAMIREREQLRHTPIVFISDVRDTQFPSHDAGAIDVVYKPVNPQLLRAKVSLFVDLGRKTGLLRQQTVLLERREEEIHRLNREIEERVEQRTAELVRANEELKQFGYAASHDLREPLRNVGSYAQLLSRRYLDKLDGEGREFMGYIIDAAHRMDTLLNDLLAYSLQMNARATVLSAVDSEAVLRGAILSLDNLIREKGASVTRDPLPEVQSDFSQLTQVFQHLLSNALKYHGEQAPRIHIGAKERPDEWMFSFEDKGVGIDPRYHEQIFGIFKRLHGRDVPGTGIGLALVKKIIERQGGRIWVESEAGQGATFRFTLPK